MDDQHSDPYLNFTAPPEAPVFTPTEEEFADPLGYIAKIRPTGLKTGIVKIKPPPDWQPPFAVNVETFKFTPRIQKLNELEAHSRIKLNFFDRLYRFWDLQGYTLKIPTVERKLLDLFTLYKSVGDLGGAESLTKERRWAQVSAKLGFPYGSRLGGTLKHHYEKLLYPYFLFDKGDTVKPVPEQKAVPVVDDTEDKDWKPHHPKTNGVDKNRKVKRGPKESPSPTKEEQNDTKDDPDIDYSANSELKKLQFFGAGPKAAVPGSKDDPNFKDESFDNRKSKLKMTITGAYSGYEKYYCHMCGRGDGDDQMLLCDGCDDAFHTYCLVPPLSEVPKGDWRCPACVKQACNKPMEPYGFDQSKRDYTLQSFGEMADHFKASYFKMPVHRVTTSQVEKEFWRLSHSHEENVMVQYGADIHAMEMGSGFPTRSTDELLPEDEEYVSSGWNLNNLPCLEQSVLCHINADISGMKVPWCYVGMCFSSFCWHIEDHWSYSINYLHWGEPKSWYGVPGSSAAKFEDAMRETAPELFESCPDLLHQLTTIMNPNLLMKKGVPIVRTDQCAGEFIVTFPRAYHAGFNQGYNFAEAVNFCPADWLPIGRACIDHYRSLHRQCVFSHEELICKMAADPNSLDLNLAAATHQDMLSMVEEERDLRKALLERGTFHAEREAFELLPDDERQCELCKTTTFLSSVTCPCKPTKLVCLYHVEDLCACPASRHVLRYRYTLDELPSMLHRLKVRAESYDNWNLVVSRALEATGDEKLDICELKDLIAEAEEKKFPESDLLQTLINAVTEAEKCSSVAAQLISKKVRTRNRQSLEGKYIAKLTLEELNCFFDQVSGLPCEIKEAKSIKDLLDRVLEFREEACEALEAETPDSEQVEALIEFGIGLDVDLPEIPKLKQVLHQARWLDEVRNSMREPNAVTLDTMRKLIEKGVSLSPHTAVEKAMAELQELLTVSERWEEKARICLQARPRHLLTTLEAIIAEARNIPAYLPNIAQLREAVKKARDWIQKVESIQSVEQYAYLEVLEGQVAKGRPIPVRLDQLPQLESQVAAAKSWKERTARTFLKKNSSFTLLEPDLHQILSPRTDIGIYSGSRCKKKRLKDGDKKDGDGGDEDEDSRASGVSILTQVAAFKMGEEKEVELMRDLRTRNMEKRHDTDAKFCVCRKPVTGFMLQCELCKDWFHSTCVSFPKSANMKNKTSQAAIMQATKEMKFLCPLCLRSRRPRLETILSLLVSLQKLPVRMVEGEALQCLTERAMAWQDRARQVLTTTEMASAMAQLSVMSQRMVEAAAREKTEKIIHAELQKAANNPELQPHLAHVTQSAFGNRDMQGELLEPTPHDLAHNSLALLTSAAKHTLMHREYDMSKEAGVGVNMDASMSPPRGALSPLPQPLVPAPNPMSHDIGAEIDIPSAQSLGMSFEHAYSSVSKGMANGSPRKAPRKSPLVPRHEGPMLDVAETKRAQLEELMMEGDLLEVSLDETQHIWRILQACYSRAEPNRYTDMEISQGVYDSKDKKDIKKREGGVIKSKEKMKRKKAAQQGEDKGSDWENKKIKVENTGENGGPPGKKKMKKPPQKKKELSGDIKEGLKNKIKADPDKPAEGTTPEVKPKPKKKKLGQGGKTPEGGKPKEKRTKMKRKVRRIGKSSVMPLQVKEEVLVMDDSDNDDEDCAANRCRRPTGEAVEWVQCDTCLKWFHLVCLGLKQSQLSEDDDFHCYACKGETNPADDPDFDLEKVKVEDLIALPLDSPPCSPSVRAAADKVISEVVEAVAESSKARRLEAEKRVEAVESMMQLQGSGSPLADGGKGDFGQAASAILQNNEEEDVVVVSRSEEVVSEVVDVDQEEMVKTTVYGDKTSKDLEEEDDDDEDDEEDDGDEEDDDEEEDEEEEEEDDEDVAMEDDDDKEEETDTGGEGGDTTNTADEDNGVLSDADETLDEAERRCALALGDLKASGAVAPGGVLNQAATMAQGRSVSLVSDGNQASQVVSTTVVPDNS